MTQEEQLKTIMQRYTVKNLGVFKYAPAVLLFFGALLLARGIR